MDYKELARQMNQLLAKGIKTPADAQTFLALDKKSGEFIRQADEKDYLDFKRRCPALEAFGMIAAGLESNS